MGFVTQPLAMPAVCSNASCGYGGNKRRYYDFGLNLDYYGVVYLCELCLRDMIDNLEGDKVAKLTKRVSELTKELQEVTNDRDSYLDALRRAERPIPVANGQSSLFDNAGDSAESDADKLSSVRRPVSVLDVTADD